jgi:NitT/TauT family transport system ATP-binding protein
VRQNVQLVRRILAELEASLSRRVRAEVILRELEGCFSPEEAERQLDTAIDWGRYAELFAYDDQEGVLYRETEEGEEGAETVR